MVRNPQWDLVKRRRQARRTRAIAKRLERLNELSDRLREDVDTALAFAHYDRADVRVDVTRSAAQIMQRHYVLLDEVRRQRDSFEGLDEILVKLARLQGTTARRHPYAQRLLGRVIYTAFAQELTAAARCALSAKSPG